MKVLIVGKNGQLASELALQAPAEAAWQQLGSNTLDITNAAEVAAAVRQWQPEVVINAAAYTAVDKAESEMEQAHRVNAIGVSNLAEVCALQKVRLLHVSTDFVFDGSKNTPYSVDDPPNPINVYGASKLAGEWAVRQWLPSHSVIVRTAWVYSAHGNNFVKTMLRLLAEKPQLRVVYDQIGTPTWGRGLAQWLWAVAFKPEVLGLYHWTDAGVTSWYDFAEAIRELALEKGILQQAAPVLPIPAVDYPTPARRPAFSVLDKSAAEAVSGLQTVHWRAQLSSMLDELKSYE